MLGFRHIVRCVSCCQSHQIILFLVVSGSIQENNYVVILPILPNDTLPVLNSRVQEE